MHKDPYIIVHWFCLNNLHMMLSLCSPIVWIMIDGIILHLTIGSRDTCKESAIFAVLSTSLQVTPSR